MINAGSVKPNMKLEIDGEPFLVVSADHVKPGKGQAFSRFKLKNLISGLVVEKTYKATEKIKKADFFVKKAQFLYKQGEEYYFMDEETYEQVMIPEGLLAYEKDYLVENIEVKLQIFKGKPVGIELPTTVDLKIIDTEPGVRGDTAAGGTKPAKLETGAVVQVPFFLNVGDVIRVDTRTGEYVERVK